MEYLDIYNLPRELKSPYLNTGHFAQKTFRTKDFSHKSFSTSFGKFAQFLVVISHNNYK